MEAFQLYERDIAPKAYGLQVWVLYPSIAQRF